MLSKEETTKVSKTLSYVLRHNPSSIDLQLDENGWAPVNELLLKLKLNGRVIDFDMLKWVVDTNNKKRFNFNNDYSMIRASQGHSIEIDLNYAVAEPPAILYHGTTGKSLPAILLQGLRKMNRHHVHLSSNEQTALNVGKRHGKPVVLTIKAGEIHAVGYAFFESDNNVWLTETVPPSYIDIKTANE